MLDMRPDRPIPHERFDFLAVFAMPQMQQGYLPAMPGQSLPRIFPRLRIQLRFPASTTQQGEAMKEQWQMTFESVASALIDIPVEARVRMLLKTALRAYDLRCVDIRKVDAAVGKTPPVDPKHDATKTEPPF
jgi:hypothetical protein